MRWLLLLLALPMLNCGGVDPPPLDCRTLGCDAGSECVEYEEGKYRCELVVDPCEDVVCESPHEDCQEGICVRDPNAPPDDRRWCNQPPDYPKTGCWNRPPGEDWHWIPEEPPPPPPGDCTLGTPTARSLAAQGVPVRAQILREGAMGIGVTAWARFGREYYCSNAMQAIWPEACAAGRYEGPVGPAGIPETVVCEKQFYEQAWAMLTTHGDNGSHMSLDPWVVINGQNQNHPRNVRNGLGTQFGDHWSWVKEEYRGHLYIVSGMMAWCTGHGTGLVCASAKGGAGQTCMRINQ